MDKLALFADFQIKANEAMREYIQTKYSELDRLEHFEEHYRSVRDKYLEYKELFLKSDKIYTELQQRLDKEIINHKQTIDNLKTNNDNLKKVIDKQCQEKEELEHQLKDCAKRFQKASPSDYLNSSINSNNSYTTNGNDSSGATYMNATSTPQPNSMYQTKLNGNNILPQVNNIIQRSMH